MIGIEINIIEPTDSRLNLFSDIREFSNFIDNNSVAKKRIGFKYENDNKIEDPSEMFIGELISITNIAGEDLLSFVDNYNFTSVRFKYTEKTKLGYSSYNGTMNDFLVCWSCRLTNFPVVEK